ncbi:MAG: hypothetical protein LBH62_03960, partial [Nitrososphaerota archaeon]|nr:hypothetical protein [Nitrososphaerota archaeon]
YHTKFYKLIGTNKQQQKETITIEEGGVLRLSGIIVTHTKDANGRGVTVNEGGKLDMTNGEISGNNGHEVDGYDYCGGGVFVASEAVFNMMDNACITGNGAGTGGGVCVQGFFNMSGGKIVGNAASFGGGVRVDTGGTFNMTGNAEITNNIVGREGGGVYVGSYFNRPGSYFYMFDNAIIANNKADSGGGGGIFVYNGQVELSGGKIAGNTASDGGGICNYGNVTMISGEIINNTASAGGGGVFNSNGPPKWTEVPAGSFVYSFFKMTGGEITNNTADNGGGIFDCLDTFNKIGGEIINNKATNIGNDICKPDDLSNG